MTRRELIRNALDDLADYELNEVARAAADEGHLDWDDVWTELDLGEILSCHVSGDAHNFEELLAAAYNRDFDPSAPYWRWGYYGPESAHDLDYDLDELADCIDDDAECSWVRYLPSAIVDAIDEADEDDGDEDFDEGNWPDDPTDYDGTDEAEEADKPTAPDGLDDIEIALCALNNWPTIGEEWTEEATRIVKAIRNVLGYLELPATEDNVREAILTLQAAGGPLTHSACIQHFRRLVAGAEDWRDDTIAPTLNAALADFLSRHHHYPVTVEQLADALASIGLVLSSAA